MSGEGQSQSWGPGAPWAQLLCAGNQMDMVVKSLSLKRNRPPITQGLADPTLGGARAPAPPSPLAEIQARDRPGPVPLKSLNNAPVSGLFCFDQNLLLGLQTKEKGRNWLLFLGGGQPSSSAPPPRSVGSGGGGGRLFPALSRSIFRSLMVSYSSAGVSFRSRPWEEMKSAVEYVMR